MDAAPELHATLRAPASLPCTSALRDARVVWTRSSQVDGVRYALFECVYLRPWPNRPPWIARIEEILSRIANNNKAQTFLGVRWFYRRRDLLPSGEADFPTCDDPEHEVYLFSGKLDEVPCSKLDG